MSSTGDAQEIPIAHWSSDSSFNELFQPTDQFSTTGPIPSVTFADPITSADQGVVLSWEAAFDAYCALTVGSPGTSSGCVEKSTDFKFTSVSGGNVAPDRSVNIPNQASPVIPTLQGEDGTYYGTVDIFDGPDPSVVHNYLVATDPQGNVKWAKSGADDYVLDHLAADGSLVVQSRSRGSLLSFDAGGNAVAQAADLGAVPAWSNGSYIASSSGVSAVALTPIEWATGYASMGGGNLSRNGSAVGVFEAVEGLPVYGLSIWGTSCKLGSDKVPLAGTALTQYNDLKNKLLTQGYITSQQCQTYFNADANRAPYFSKLAGGVEAQVPYDGRKTNISQFDAGFWASPPYTDHDLSVLKKVPVCGLWMPFNGANGSVVQPDPRTIVVATSQIQPPGTDIYINTKSLKNLKQSTILHEVLHNITGLLDATDLNSHLLDLKTFVGIPSTPGATGDISKQLELSGCVNPN